MQRYSHSFTLRQHRIGCTVSQSTAQRSHPYHQGSCSKVWNGAQGPAPEGLGSYTWKSALTRMLAILRTYLEQHWHRGSDTVMQGLQRVRQVMQWEHRARAGENLFPGDVNSQRSPSWWVVLAQRSVQRPPSKVSANFNHDCHLSAPGSHGTPSDPDSECHRV